MVEPFITSEINDLRERIANATKKSELMDIRCNTWVFKRRIVDMSDIIQHPINIKIFTDALNAIDDVYARLNARAELLRLPPLPNPDPIEEQTQPISETDQSADETEIETDDLSQTDSDSVHDDSLQTTQNTNFLITMLAALLAALCYPYTYIAAKMKRHHNDEHTGDSDSLSSDQDFMQPSDSTESLTHEPDQVGEEQNYPVLLS
jgi:hypothetical protein